MIDPDLFEEYLKQLEDRFTAEELVFEMGLSTIDIIEAFRDHLERFPINIEKYRED